MQTAIVIERSEWESVLSRLERVERLAATAEQVDTNEAKRLLTTEQAAGYLNVHPESVRRARRKGRLQGEQANERDYSFRKSELDRYTKRYHRP